MLDVSVKTLDGTNRAYSLPDAITVKEFKEKIAESISIVPDRQRLIFQGRVLQDEKKLSEYNVSGKVIHVVERPPPDMRRSARETTGNGSSDRSRRHGQSGPPGGGMSIGAFGLPDMVDPNHIQNLVQQTLSGMGDLGRNARVTSRTSSDGSAVDVHINLTRNGVTVASESQQRILHAHRLLAHVKYTLDKLENPGSSPATATPLYEANGTAPVNPDLATPISMSNDVSPNSASTASAGSSISTQATQTGADRGTQGTQTSTGTGSQTGKQSTPIGTQTGGQAEQTGTQTNWQRTETSTQGTQISTQASSRMETSSQSTQLSAQSMETGTQSTLTSTQSTHTGTQSMETSPLNAETSSQSTQTGGRQSTRSASTSTIPSTSSSGTGQTASASGSTSASASNGTSTGASGSSPPASRNEEHPETQKLGELMNELKEVERRLQPYRDQYYRLVVDDPELDGEARADSQRVYNYVSSCLHHLAHVYHHISDLTLDFTQARPRRLRAAANPPPAPTAVIHQTIPVQAQVSLISARPIRSARSRSRGHGANRTANQTSQVTANIPLSTTGTTTSSTTSSASTTTSSTTNPGTTSAGTASTGTTTTTTSTNSTTGGGGGVGGIPPGGFGFPFGVGAQAPPMMFMEMGPNSLSVNSISTHVVREGEDSQHDLPQFVQPPQFAFGGVPQRPGAPADFMGNLMRMAQQASQRMAGPRGPMAPPPPPSTTPAQPASGAATPPSGAQTPPQGAPAGAGGIGAMPRVPPIVQMDNRSVDPFMVCNSRHYSPMRQHPQRQNGEAAVNEVVNSLISSLVQGGQLSSSTSTSTTTTGATSTPAANLGTTNATLAGLLSGNAGPGVGGGSFAESFRNILSQGGSLQPQQPGGNAENQMSDQMFLDMVSGITSNLGQMMAGQQQQQTSLLDFLNSIDPTHNVAMGEGIISEFYVAISRKLTFPDLIELFTGRAAPLQRLRPTLQTFVNERILLGENPTEENVDRAIERLCEEENFHASIVDICQQSHVTVVDDVDFPATLMALLTHQLRTVIHVIMNSTAEDEEFAQRLFDQCRSALHELVVLTRRCLTNGMDGVDQLVRNRVSSASMSVANPMIRTWLVNTSSMNLQTLTPSITLTERDVQHYIVTKRQSESMDVDSTPTATPPPETTTPTSQEATPPAEMAEAVSAPSDSEESFEDAISSMDGSVGRTMSESSLETEGAPVSGRDSQDWRAVVPQEWVPIIQRDGEIQRQEQGGRRAPYSEAYISGMPAKRRKVMLPENDLVAPSDRAVPLRQTGIRPAIGVDSLQRDLAAQTETVTVAYNQGQVVDVQERPRREEPDCNRRRLPNTGKKN